jgi:hypothetical protein
MNTRTLVKNEMVNGKKVLVDSINDHFVVESLEDIKTLMERTDDRKLTLGAINSGYSVDIQRDMANTLTRSEKLDRIAQTKGFIDNDDMMSQFNAWIAAGKPM